jgi:cytosine/uracil/thiamine/allantoin permease
MALLESDTGIYVLSGVFTIAVFALAIAAVISRTGADFTATMLTLTVGFTGFVGVYFVALVVYRGVERRERAE